MAENKRNVQQMLFEKGDGSSSDDSSAEYVDGSGTSQTEQGVFKTKELSENEPNPRPKEPEAENRWNNQVTETGNRKVEYKPKRVRNDGVRREGLCGLCNQWFKLKTSSYWYHMNYKHGINKNGYKIPTTYETRENKNRLFAYCTLCKTWIEINGKNTNRSFGWRRHYRKKHANYFYDP